MAERAIIGAHRPSSLRSRHRCTLPFSTIAQPGFSRNFNRDFRGIVTGIFEATGQSAHDAAGARDFPTGINAEHPHAAELGIGCIRFSARK